MNLSNFFSNSFSASSSTKSNEAGEAEIAEEAGEENDQEFETESDDCEILSPRKRKKHSHKFPAGGGQSKFQIDYLQKFGDHSIMRGKDDGHFRCKACGFDYNLGKNGDKNIQTHINTGKHKKNLADFNKNQPLANFIQTKSVKQLNKELAAEITMAYHCARHNHSLRSADCSSELYPTIFPGCSAATNFASKRSKTAAILNGVIAPFLKHQILDEVTKSGGNYSIGLDSDSITTISCPYEIIKFTKNTNSPFNRRNGFWRVNHGSFGQNRRGGGGRQIVDKLRESFQLFLNNTIEYLDRWTGPLEEIGEFAAGWLIFEQPPTVQAVKSAYRKYCSKDEKDLDELFLEIGSLKNLLGKLNQTSFSGKKVEEKWAIIFKDPSFIHHKKIVSMLLSIFSSNAYCESVFSVVKNIKTDERNRMKIKLLNSLLSVKLNSDFDCKQAYNLFISDSNLLNKVKNNDKYEE